MTRPAAVPDKDRTFTALTFNVFYGTDPARLAPAFDRARDRGASLFHVVEAGNAGVRRLLRDRYGLHTFFHPAQYLMAWDPKVWRGLDPAHQADRYGVRMARSIYFTTSGNPVVTNAAVVELLHRPSHLSLQAMAYHTPASVQKAPGQMPPNRIKVLREAADTWARLAADAKARGIDAALYAGDDNVDERRGTGSSSGQWDFMLRAATGLTQVQAPMGTLGGSAPGPNGRRIDDFRQYGLRRQGPGEVYATASDHHAYVQRFQFRRLHPDADRLPS